MSVLAVARKDFTGARRSRTLWTAAVGLGLIAVLLAFTSQGYRQSSLEVVRRTFRTLTMILGVLLPIVALVASYLAIAGEREGGGIKFLLSLPNTRRDVFVGKLLSRLVVVAAGVCLMYVAATSVSLSKHGAFPAGVIAGTLLVSAVYGSVFVSVAVSLSAMAASRSRAIAGSLVAYFGLIILYVFPVIQVAGVVRWLHGTMLGMEANPDLYNAVQYTSPYLAYQKAINLVVPDGLETRLFLDSARNLEEGARMGAVRADPELPLYLTDEFSLVILGFWLVAPLLAGYWAFERTDLE